MSEYIGNRIVLAMMVSGTKQKNMSLLPLCMRNPQATAI